MATNTDAISRSAALDIIKEERRFIERLRETTFDNEDRAHNTGELGRAIRLARKIKDIPALDVAQIVANGQDTTYLRVKSLNGLRGRIVIDEESGNRCAMYYEEEEDFAPAVRCKDCKHRCTFRCLMYHTETCLDDLDGFDDYTVDRTDDDGFCHLGARMDGEADE